MTIPQSLYTGMIIMLFASALAVSIAAAVSSIINSETEHGE